MAMLGARRVLCERLMKPVADVRTRYEGIADPEDLDRYEKAVRGEIEMALDAYAESIEQFFAGKC